MPLGLHVLDAMAREGFEEVSAVHDERSGLRAFVGIHDTSAGPAFGGIRRFAYRDERSALMDALRLSIAMTHKCALADLGAGGGKIVILDRAGLDLRAAYRAIGRTVERLGGRYYAGPDVGTGEAELRWVREATSHCVPAGADGPGDLPTATCVGVFAGLAAALRELDGAEDWPRRTVVIQGLGRVGEQLARRLRSLDARVVASELDEVRAQALGHELGLEIVAPGTEFDVACDVFSPCAMGGILHDLTIQRLRARVVCGAANNPLANGRHGERLHERRILYVPDIVASSGAVLAGATFQLSGVSVAPAEIERRVGELAAWILRTAQREDLSPARVAQQEADARLRRRRALGGRRSPTLEPVRP